MSCPGVRPQSAVIYNPRERQVLHTVSRTSKAHTARESLPDLPQSACLTPQAERTRNASSALSTGQLSLTVELTHLPSKGQLPLPAELTMENSDTASRTPARGWEGYKLSLTYDLGQAKLVTWPHLHLQDKGGRSLNLSTS